MPGQILESGSTPAVVVQADDPLIRDGVIAFMEASHRVLLLTEDRLTEANVVVLIAGSVTGRTLSAMSSVAHATSRSAGIVLVAETIAENQFALAVNHGLSSFLPRASTSLQQVLTAALQSHQGRSALPPRLTRALVDRMRQMQSREITGLLPYDLVPREVEVLRFLADGKEVQEIAAELNYSERHIKGIIRTAVRRLGQRNRTQAIAHAIREGIL